MRENKLIYLDFAAATPMDERVLAAMLPYFSTKFYNPSATYLPAQDVRRDLVAARARVAHCLGAKPSEVVFAAGGTEANNLAIQGVMARFADANIVVSAIEHESVLQAAQRFEYREAAVLPTGIVDLEDLRAQIDDKTVLISIMYANNEVGTIQPLHQIAQIVAEIKATRQKQGNELPLYLHTDAAQAANYLDLHVSRLGVDLLTLNGGKIYGPKQTGVLFVSSKVLLQPQILGGGQERGMRSGTENVAGVIGLATALDAAQEYRHQEAARLQKLQKLFFDLLAEKIPQTQVNGSRKNRLPNNVHITIPDQDNETLLLRLESVGVLCSAGSACSASSKEPSHVLRAMGLDDDAIRASLRLTLGRSTTREDITNAVSALAGILSS